MEGAWNQSLLDPIHKVREHARWDIMTHIGEDLTYEEVCGYYGIDPVTE